MFPQFDNAFVTKYDYTTVVILIQVVFFFQHYWILIYMQIPNAIIHYEVLIYSQGGVTKDKY